MERSRMGCLAALVTTVVFAFTGCGGSQVAPTSSAPQGATIATHGKSWMLPGSSSGDLLYVAGRGAADQGVLYVITYPEGQLVGEVSLPYSGDIGGICSDSNGNIFVPSGEDAIWEYAHGGTQPIATLSVDSGWSNACAVDPRTGNLAVTNDKDYPYKGDVAIYAGAQGKPTYYSDSEIANPFHCGYDDRGNLFLDGDGPFAELLAGSGNLTNITLNKKHNTIGQVQWDGTYITVTSQNANKIYRLQISGSTGKVIGTTQLRGPGRNTTSQSWIQGSTIIAPIGPNSRFRGDDSVGIWNYPAGGKAITIVKVGRPHRYPNAETVSVGSNR
jgi:hypothetical protein